MAASQPAAKLGVTNHQTEAAQAEKEIDNIKHELSSASVDRRAEDDAINIKSRLGNRDDDIKSA